MKWTSVLQKVLKMIFLKGQMRLLMIFQIAYLASSYLDNIAEYLLEKRRNSHANLNKGYRMNG